MDIAYLAVAVVAVAANAFSGIGSMSRARPVVAAVGPAMDRLGIPATWLVFPIGALKAAGAAGILLGLLGVPLVGAAAAAGLVLYFVCAAFAHIRVGDYSPQFYLATCFFLPLAAATLALDPGVSLTAAG